jgi:hypothetical protein
MRHVRTLIAAAALAALTVSGCSSVRGDRGTAAPGQPSAASPSPAPGGADPSSPSTGRRPAGGTAAAVATARAFLDLEVGMRRLAAEPFRLTGRRTGEVGFRHRFGENGRRLPLTGPPAAVVSLYRLDGGGWMVLGVRGRAIQVDGPARLQPISSPLALRGRASAFEGTVNVKVTQDGPGRDPVLGSSFVTGSGEATPGPFSGRIAFRPPTAASGWVIFSEYGAASGGGVVQATAVRVRFAPVARAPRILGVTTAPALPRDGGFQRLPDGAGTLLVSVRASDTERVRFLLTPTGTDVADLATVLGEDRDGRDGFSLRWSYPDRPLLTHLTARAIGPGGTTEEVIGLYHADS